MSSPITGLKRKLLLQEVQPAPSEEECAGLILEWITLAALREQRSGSPMLLVMTDAQSETRPAHLTGVLRRVYDACLAEGLEPQIEPRYAEYGWQGEAEYVVLYIKLRNFGI